MFVELAIASLHLVKMGANFRQRLSSVRIKFKLGVERKNDTRYNISNICDYFLLMCLYFFLLANIEKISFTLLTSKLRRAGQSGNSRGRRGQR